MDCASCAAKIEKAVRSIDGVADVEVSIVSQVMTLKVAKPERELPKVKQAVTDLGYHLDRLGGGQPGSDDDDMPSAAHLTPAYRLAMWAVVLLNLGYGIIEIVGGFIAGSQALKADALDFLGDGLITLLGLLAIGWSTTWRARAALLQGFFLALLGVGVLVNTAYRVIVRQAPGAELMGILGAIALAVNVIAALVLIPHRHGDANVRAVWLFSRNDAIGNFAVVVAAGLVAWTHTPWPDLVVAAAIAGLFMQSAWTIIRHARKELASAPALVPERPR
jgi:Co/Zn/Cd efflux system component/copper chaperone CopZ